jgi:Leucine-rich repeat (LRR) protein
MTRLTSLLLANNRVSKIDAGVAKYLPNLETLVLSGNRIESMAVCLMGRHE